MYYRVTAIKFNFAKKIHNMRTYIIGTTYFL